MPAKVHNTLLKYIFPATVPAETENNVALHSSKAHKTRINPPRGRIARQIVKMQPLEDGVPLGPFASQLLKLRSAYGNSWSVFADLVNVVTIRIKGPDQRGRLVLRNG